MRRRPTSPRVGIVECEIIQWFVEPGARVEEFSKLCEVQSDKASVEITSRFAGVVKKIYYEAGEMARVGKPFVDIDIQGDVSQAALDELTPSAPEESGETSAPDPRAAEAPQIPTTPAVAKDGTVETTAPKPKGRHAALATPAVRHLCKELKLDILEVDGTGKEGRVLKEDIYKFMEARKSNSSQPPVGSGAPTSSEVQQETHQPLTKTQEGMFKTMTRSLNIPHFLYADEIDFTELAALRTRLNKVLSASSSSRAPLVPQNEGVSKLSYLPFIVKAVSIALQQYPILNSRIDVSSDKPGLIYRNQHNIGVAMDTPSGLLVPVIKNVGAHSVLTIAAELSRLQALAVAGKLSHQDMVGGTITVSNIGSIGGTYCSPVIVEGQVAILGVGRMRDMPDVVEDPAGGWKVNGIRKVCNFSWSADHRVVDGATMARAAEVVRALVEEPDVMVMHLR
ncbi:hypothetical protein N0V82_009674 [Gnomoniopsis sp. IMI 355080]|nr:hypothetical protein N0V82_009674 [Gnomoniopsis sp. IMI 355080]